MTFSLVEGTTVVLGPAQQEGPYGEVQWRVALCTLAYPLLHSSSDVEDLSIEILVAQALQFFGLMRIGFSCLHITFK